MSEGMQRFHQCMPWGSFSIVQRSGRSTCVEVGPTHENPGFELSWIGAGTFEFLLGGSGGRVVSASTGASILLPPRLLNTPRGATSFVQQILLCESVLDEAADAVGAVAAVPAEARPFGADSSVSAIARAIWLEVGASRDEGALDSADPVLESLVDALSLTLVRSPSRPRRERIVEPGIRRALDRIRTSYGEALRVEDLARTAGLSRFEFLRKFAAQVGDSPHRYLTAVRLDHAATLLRTTQRSILDVSLECGFGDPSRFARAFAARFGATPRVWRATIA